MASASELGFVTKIRDLSGKTCVVFFLFFVYYIYHIYILCLFPTCQVRVVRFYVRCTAPPSSCSPLPPSSLDLICQLLIAVIFAGPPLPALIAAGLAGPPLPALERSGPRRTSTASSCQTPTASARSRRTSTGDSLSAVGFAASTGESLSAVGFAGLQPARV